MSLLARLKKLEAIVNEAILAGRAPDAKSMRLLDEMMAGTLFPEVHEEAAVKLVLSRIQKRLGFGTPEKGGAA